MTGELPSLTMLPYEVHTMILQYAVIDILHDLRRSDCDISYTVRLQRWLNLRLVCKMFDTILSQMTFEGDSLEALLKCKQLEKLGYALEAFRLTADESRINPRVSLPKIKFMCGRFWHNPEFSVDCIRAIFSILPYFQRINFTIKLEPWILRHATQNEGSWESPDGTLAFERGDRVVDGGVGLQIHRVSRLRYIAGTPMGIYLTHEYGHPLGPVHERLGHERRWFLQYMDDIGLAHRQKISVMVNYKTGMIWNHSEKKLIDFQGQEYQFQALEDEDEDEDDSEDEEDEGD
jgi:hypothetical protein